MVMVQALDAPCATCCTARSIRKGRSCSESLLQHVGEQRGILTLVDMCSPCMASVVLPNQALLHVQAGLSECFGRGRR